MTERDFAILALFYEERIEELTPAYLAYRMRIDATSASQLLDDLVRNGTLNLSVDDDGNITYRLPGSEQHRMRNEAHAPGPRIFSPHDSPRGRPPGAPQEESYPAGADGTSGIPGPEASYSTHQSAFHQQSAYEQGWHAGPDPQGFDGSVHGRPTHGRPASNPYGHTGHSPRPVPGAYQHAPHGPQGHPGQHQHHQHPYQQQRPHPHQQQRPHPHQQQQQYPYQEQPPYPHQQQPRYPHQQQYHPHQQYPHQPYGAYNAPNQALQRRPHHHGQLQPAHHPANPFNAALLSFMLVGAGQWYNGEFGKGVGMLFGCLVLWLFLLGWIVNIWSMVDAYKVAQRRQLLQS